ncbi:unnamed protein product [Ambrosiozyma monospora]|uniref:Unnamed protein product n=1 Tax=Ambrosiozyma monospora TaxID=43982 RepID=A0ACB5T8C4_AMBMO|nr:unnamed protein product [Ambrosiozyma monospora]
MVSFTKLATSIIAITTCANAFTLNYALGFPGAPDRDTKPIPGESPLQTCDTSDSQLLKLTKVDLTPNPPLRGENLTITAAGTLKEPIEQGAYVDVDVTYGYIKLIHQTYDLCEQLPNVEMECPIKQGYQELTKQVEIPDEVPPGKYTVVARAYTEDDELITCLTAVVEFPPYGYAKIIDLIAY